MDWLVLLAFITFLTGLGISGPRCDFPRSQIVLAEAGETNPVVTLQGTGS